MNYELIKHHPGVEFMGRLPLDAALFEHRSQFLEGTVLLDHMMDGRFRSAVKPVSRPEPSSQHGRKKLNPNLDAVLTKMQ